MAKDIDQELAATFGQLEVMSPKRSIQKGTSTDIESNPLYKRFNTTDLRLWQQSSPERANKTTISKKSLRPLIKHDKTINKTKKIIKCNGKQMNTKLEWVSAVCQKRPQFEPCFNMQELITECDNVMEMSGCRGELKKSNSSEMNELMAYFNTELHLPKNMSEMAKTMYS